jgi:hypothetical protein
LLLVSASSLGVVSLFARTTESQTNGAKVTTTTTIIEGRPQVIVVPVPRDSGSSTDSFIAAIGAVVAGIGALLTGVAAMRSNYGRKAQKQPTQPATEDETEIGSS